MRWKPAGSVVVLTGASSGIGNCLTKLLVAGGAQVIAVARRQSRLDELVRETQTLSGDGQVVPLAGDITNAQVQYQAIQAASELGNGRMDLLVNNAGIGAIGSFVTANPERLRRIMEVNFFAPAELTRLAIPLLKAGNAPVICNISSVLGRRAVPDKSEYSASKFAMHGLSQSLRAELKPSGIQVTVVSPSTTRSEFFDSLIDTGHDQASKSIGSWAPEKVAKATFSAIHARRAEAVLSWPGKALVLGDRLLPPLMDFVLAKRK